jgi:effector-binding domain-containing protein
MWILGTAIILFNNSLSLYFYIQKMKILLKVIIGLFVIYLALAIFGPKSKKVERKIVIAASPEILAPYLVDLKVFHETWSPWAEKDKNMKVIYSGVPSQAEHKMEWTSEVEQVGVGSLELWRLSADSIIYGLSFSGMDAMPYYYIAKNVEGGTEITLGLKMEATFLFRPMMMWMDAEKEIAPDFERGLSNLKKVAEAAADQSKLAYQVNEIEFPETFFVGTKFKNIPVAEVEKFCGENFPEIGKALIAQNVKPTAAPMAFFKNYNFEKGTTDIAVVSRVASGVKLKGFESHTYPSSKALQVVFNGSYANIVDAHNSIGQVMVNKGYKEQIAIEEYITDPKQEKDTAKWVTNIFYLVK